MVTCSRDPLYVVRHYIAAAFLKCGARSKLNHIHGVASAAAVPRAFAYGVAVYAEAKPLCRVACYRFQLLLPKLIEKQLHAAGSQRRGDILRTARCCAYQAEISGQTVRKNIMYVRRDGRVIRRIICAFEEYAPVLKHLQQLIHLHGVQFAYFIQKQHAAMRLCDRAGLGLGYALRAERARALIDRVVHGTDERIGNAPFVKADAGCVKLNEL